jgi:hypothetical protein
VQSEWGNRANRGQTNFSNTLSAGRPTRTKNAENGKTMKAKDKTKPSDTGSGSQCVCLELTHPTAQKACIAGSFNDWHPSVTPMIRLSDGKWAKELALPHGRHEYRFVVDGEWVDDPAATELIPNSFGTANAVLVVAASKSPVAARPVSASPATRQQAPKSTPRGSRAAPEPTPRSAGTSTLATLFRRASLL